MNNNEILIYTDGACSGNPGPGGWGAIIIFDQTVQELGGSETQTTNNRMEALSILESLKWIEAKGLKKPLCIYSDSQYVIKALTQWLPGWKRNNWQTASGMPVKNQDLFENISQQLNKISYRFQYVPGHQGFWGNERADQIAVSFSKSKVEELYQGPWENYAFSHENPETIAQNISSSSNKATTQLVGYIVWDYKTLMFFKDWLSCAKVTQGRSGVRFKKIKNKDELKDFVIQNGCPESELKKIEQVYK